MANRSNDQQIGGIMAGINSLKGDVKTLNSKVDQLPTLSDTAIELDKRYATGWVL